MSRKGKTPIKIPPSVTIKTSGAHVAIKGPKGEMAHTLLDGFSLEIVNDTLHVRSSEKVKRKPEFWGLTQALLKNHVVGVSEGFVIELLLSGVGYKGVVKGTTLDLTLGYSHPVLMEIPTGIEVQVEKNTTLILRGIDRQKLGQFAADIYAQKKPDPYKGHGVCYKNRPIRRKAGKSGKKK